MYKVMVDCQLGDLCFAGGQRNAAGFLTVKIEPGPETEARRNAIARTKTLMMAKGYSGAEIDASHFSIEEIEAISNIPEDRMFENSFIYYES